MILIRLIIVGCFFLLYLIFITSKSKNVHLLKRFSRTILFSVTFNRSKLNSDFSDFRFFFFLSWLRNKLLHNARSRKTNYIDLMMSSSDHIVNKICEVLCLGVHACWEWQSTCQILPQHIFCICLKNLLHVALWTPLY